MLNMLIVLRPGFFASCCYTMTCMRYYQYCLMMYRLSYSVMVSTLDFESKNLSSNLGRTLFFFANKKCLSSIVSMCSLSTGIVYRGCKTYVVYTIYGTGKMPTIVYVINKKQFRACST